MFITLARLIVFSLMCRPCYGGLRHFSLPDYRSHPCIRDCRNSTPMTCEYNFTTEYYYTLTKACYNCPFNVTDCDRYHCIPADGAPRGLMTVNRMLPGPGIHVCVGDTLVVNVYNRLDGALSTTIHWHGILQHGTPYMDGVGMLTQCPIPYYSTFQYRFRADNVGTHFWHAHSGLQRADGIFGAFIVRQPDFMDVHRELYDFDLPEHTVIINEWLAGLSVNEFVNHHNGEENHKPASLLINGKGTYKKVMETGTGNESYTPYEVFRVDPGKRYRFRVISSGIFNCPLHVSIDNHTLRAIASDGHPFKYVDVESMNIFAGERYDVILETNQNVGNYWLRVRQDTVCSFNKASQLAIIRYKGAPEEHPVLSKEYLYGERNGKKLNPYNKAGSETLIQVADLETLVPDDKSLQEYPDKKFFLAMDFQQIDKYTFQGDTLDPINAMLVKMYTYVPQINHISNLLPPAPILPQYEDVPNELLCNADNQPRNCTWLYCECIHLIEVAMNDTVELIIVDEGNVYDANHPMHLHGHGFRVVGMGKLGSSTTLQEVQELDKNGKLTRNLNTPILKDTVTVPDGGYVILRIYANNPGFWFMHCHIEFHAERGMGFILQVGGWHQLPPKPKNLPRCGDFNFAGYESGGPRYENSTQETLNSAQSVHSAILLCMFCGVFYLLFLSI